MGEQKKVKTRKAIEFQTTNLDWFYSRFGEGTSLSWFCNLMMGKAKEIYESEMILKNAAPAGVAETAMKLVKEELDEKGI